MNLPKNSKNAYKPIILTINEENLNNDLQTMEKPMTRQQVADKLGISTKTLSRFIKNEGIETKPRTLLMPKLVATILQKYGGE